MDYVDAASQLGAAIAQSEEFQAWKEAETALILDEKAPVLMQEYKDLQVKLVQGSRDDLAKEELEKILEISHVNSADRWGSITDTNYYYRKDVVC